MYTLSDRWTDIIAEVSGQEEFQNCVIEIRDPSLIEREYDDETGEWIEIGDPLVWSGQARYIPYRWGVNHEGENTANASSQVAGMVQVPKNAVARVNRGWVVNVTESTDNPSLLTFQFKITSDLQGSNAASRTFEVSTDTDQVVS